MLLKGMCESFLLSKDEPLTLDIDGVVALLIVRRRAQNTKIGRKMTKIGPLDSQFYFIIPPPLVRSCSIFSRKALEANGLPKIWIFWAFLKPDK